MSSLHRDWDHFPDADACAIRQHLATVTVKLTSEPEQVFILWLPLRRKEHLNLPDGSQAGAIVSEYPGDNKAELAFLEEEDFPLRLAAQIPMLRHLITTAFWDFQKHGLMEPFFEVRLDDGANRVALLQSEDSALKRSSSLRGRIQIASGISQLSLGFSGIENYGWTRKLEAMRGHELWPSSYVRNEKGHYQEVKDKPQPHGAVLFSRSHGKGQLITNWSVSLHLDEGQSVETVRCEDAQDFRLTLHGYFFVDPGRQKVYGLEQGFGQALKKFESEDSLRRAWNCELLRSTVLPLLLPALRDFCAEERLSDKEKTTLTAALNNTSVVCNFRTPITEQNSWLRNITPNGINWRLRSAERTVLKLTAPPEKDPSRPWRLFPALHSIAESHWLAITDAPNLLHPSVEAQWQESQLYELFASVDAQSLFAEATLLDYLASFLDGPAGPNLTTTFVKRVLAGLIRKGLMDNGEKVLRRNETRVQRIVAHLDSSECFKIDNDLPPSLLRGLLDTDTEVLPLPSRFVPRGISGDANLSISDAAQLLKKVEATLAEGFDSDKALQDAALKLSDQLIKGVAAQKRPRLMQGCADLRVLGGFDCKENRNRPINPILRRRLDLLGSPKKLRRPICRTSTPIMGKSPKPAHPSTGQSTSANGSAVA